MYEIQLSATAKTLYSLHIYLVICHLASGGLCIITVYEQSIYTVSESTNLHGFWFHLEDGQSVFEVPGMEYRKFQLNVAEMPSTVG